MAPRGVSSFVARLLWQCSVQEALVEALVRIPVRELTLLTRED